MKDNAQQRRATIRRLRILRTVRTWKLILLANGVLSDIASSLIFVAASQYVEVEAVFLAPGGIAAAICYGLCGTEGCGS